MSDADRLARKKAARRRRGIPPPPPEPIVMMCSALGDKLPTTPEGKAAIQEIANAAAKIADRMTINVSERAPKRGKWTLCASCEAIAAGHVFGPCGRCGSTSTARFKDGKPVEKKRRLSAGDSVPDELSGTSGMEPEPKSHEPTQEPPPGERDGPCYGDDHGPENCGRKRKSHPVKRGGASPKRERGITDPNLPW